MGLTFLGEREHGGSPDETYELRRRIGSVGLVTRGRRTTRFLRKRKSHQCLCSPVWQCEPAGSGVDIPLVVLH